MWCKHNIQILNMCPFAFHAGVGMHILNTDFYGYIIPNEKYKDINEASSKFFQFKLKTLGKITSTSTLSYFCGGTANK